MGESGKMAIGILMIAIPLLFISWSIILALLVNYISYQTLNIYIFLALIIISFILCLISGSCIFNYFKAVVFIRNHWRKKNLQVLFVSLELNNLFIILYMVARVLIAKEILSIIFLFMIFFGEVILILITFHHKNLKLFLKNVTREANLYRLEFHDQMGKVYIFYSKRAYEMGLSYQCIVDRYQNIYKVR